MQRGRCIRRCGRIQTAPFATFANERNKPKTGDYMGELYSSASIAKQYLRLIGITPLLDKQPGFHASCSATRRVVRRWPGRRARTKARRPVRVLDFTANYPTISCLQGLDKLLVAPEMGSNT